MEEAVLYVLLAIFTVFFLSVGIILRYFRIQKQRPKTDIVSLFGVKGLVEKKEDAE
jgi:hypothetical protein